MGSLFGGLLLFFLFTTIPWASCQVKRTYTNCLSLDVPTSSRLWWKINEKESTIDIGFSSRVRGYFALGLSVDGTLSSGGKTNGGMTFSDAWVASVSPKKGDFCYPYCLLDVYMPDDEQPRIDAFNDLSNVIVNQGITTLTVEFTRPLKAAHSSEDLSFTPGIPQYLVWAYHPLAYISGSDLSQGIPKYYEMGHTLVDIGRVPECSLFPSIAGVQLRATGNGTSNTTKATTTTTAAVKLPLKLDEALAVIIIGLLFIWVFIRAIHKLRKYIVKRIKKSRKERSGQIGFNRPTNVSLFNRASRMNMQGVPNPAFRPDVKNSDIPLNSMPPSNQSSANSLPVNKGLSRETTVIPDRNVPRATISSERPTPIVEGPFYRPGDVPDTNGVFSGSYYRGSTIVVPKAVEQKRKKRATKMLSMPEGIRVHTDKDIVTIKSKNFFESLVYGLVYNRIPYTQVPVGFVILFAIFMGICLACLPFNPTIYQAFGDMAAAIILFTALPAARNSFMVGMLGIPYDRSIMIHRWVARWFQFIVLIHVILSWIYWATTPSQVSISYQSSQAKYIYGYVSWALVLVMFFTSIEYVRRKYFNVFVYSHILVIPFYVIISLHDNEMYPYTISAAGLYVLDYLVRAMWGSVFPTRTSSIKYKDGDIIQIKFERRLISRLLQTHKIGQYYFLNFPQVAPFEWHPFSVSSGPDEAHVEVHIKALGDHTTNLVNIAKGRGSMWLRTDGPYGNPKFNYRRFPTLVLCAGGIGITPIMGIIKDAFRYGLKDQSKKHHSVLEKIVLVWTVKDEQQFRWFEEELVWCKMASQNNKDLPQLEYMIYVTKGQVAEGLYSGRPEFESIFEKAAGKTKEKSPEKPKVVCVFCCGPRKLVNQSWDAAVVLDREGYPFQYHHECFEF